MVAGESTVAVITSSLEHDVTSWGDAATSSFSPDADAGTLKLYNWVRQTDTIYINAASEPWFNCEISSYFFGTSSDSKGVDFEFTPTDDHSIYQDIHLATVTVKSLDSIGRPCKNYAIQLRIEQAYFAGIDITDTSAAWNY